MEFIIVEEILEIIQLLSWFVRSLLAIKSNRKMIAQTDQKNPFHLVSIPVFNPLFENIDPLD